MSAERGSGTFVGIDTLTRSLRQSGWTIRLITPRLHLPIYTAERILFNETLRFRQDLDQGDLSVGFDLDGYALPRTVRRRPHIASIKGVIADEMKYEKGLTHATMKIQAHFEALHVKRAQFVVTTSDYAASRLKNLYGIPKVHAIIPELIDLAEWQEAVSRCDARRNADRFVVLCVGRFYPRKRMELLIYAAQALGNRIPNLELRIIGGGPESRRLHGLRASMGLGNVVIRENITQSELFQEYVNCDVFCLPSVQEGFGIVFLEAMACDKPIIAARAAAVPEVVKHGILTDPDSVAGLAQAIEKLHGSPAMRNDLAQAGSEWVRNFDAPRVAQLFASAIGDLAR